jgi:flagellar motor switch protein FliG
LLAMTTAEHQNDKIRRIAVLVASVETAVGRQLLLHLPTEIAKQVRRALQNLGTIDPAERQRILADFQSTAARQSAAKMSARTSTAGSEKSDQPVPEVIAFSQANAGYGGVANPQPTAEVLNNPDRSGGPNAEADRRTSFSLGEHVAGPEVSWKCMDAKALSRFIRGERATVIAVVLNQLAPAMGVAVLQHLPVDIHRDVLLQLTNLQDIDAEAMLAIEEHLAERLHDYQLTHHESLGARRVAALMAAAPPELQQDWSRLLNPRATREDPNPILLSKPGASSNAATSALTADSDVNSEKFAMNSPATPTTAATATENTSENSESHFSPNGSSRPTVASPTADDDAAHILPFPTATGDALSAVDRSLIQLEFESILQLPAHQLAQLLSAADTQTVLLALAGASPIFMKRFYGILTKADGKILAKRLSQIGPLKLRDIDEAQRKIADTAANLRRNIQYQKPDVSGTAMNSNNRPQRSSVAA